MTSFCVKNIYSFYRNASGVVLYHSYGFVGLLELPDAMTTKKVKLFLNAIL